MNPGNQDTQRVPVPADSTVDDGIEITIVSCILYEFHRCNRPVRYTARRCS